MNSFTEKSRWETAGHQKLGLQECSCHPQVADYGRLQAFVFSCELVMLPVLDRFDKYVEAVFFGTLAPDGFDCSADRIKRARLRASLPTPRGCGLFRAADQGKVA